MNGGEGARAMSLPVTGRLVAAVLCLSAIAGIGLELTALLANGFSIGTSAVILARYFTILTNALLAIVFGIIALGRIRSDLARLTGGIVSAIVLVGVVFALLLQDVRTLEGTAVLADFLLHRFNPILAALYWLAFTPKGRLRWSDPFRWALYPLAYLVYALIRGPLEGLYAYPFIDVTERGWPAVIITSAILAAGFIAASELLVWLDRTLARRWQ